MTPKQIPFARYFDWFSFALTLSLALIGIIFIFSSTYTSEQQFSIFFKKQIIGVATGLIIYGICTVLDYRSLMRWGYFFYFCLIGMLIFTLIKGHVGMGGQRWINLFFFRMQPSELAKLLFPAFLSYYLYTIPEQDRLSFTHFFPALCMLGFSFLLILKQPDLGTALIVLFSGSLLLWIAGLSTRFFLYALLACSLTTPLLWHCLKEYQKKRVLVFFGYGQSHKERYQIEQATIAIGSGGLIGKGYMNGTQNKLQFLPESRTDFIFAVISEEFGFCGSILVLLLYSLLCIRLLYKIKNVSYFFAMLFAFGLLIHIMLSACINLCMVLGLLPVVGIPLPFISYGITNLWINFASLGIVQGIITQRSRIKE